MKHHNPSSFYPSCPQRQRSMSPTPPHRGVINPPPHWYSRNAGTRYTQEPDRPIAIQHIYQGPFYHPQLLLRHLPPQRWGRRTTSKCSMSHLMPDSPFHRSEMHQPYFSRYPSSNELLYPNQYPMYPVVQHPNIHFYQHDIPAIALTPCFPVCSLPEDPYSGHKIENIGIPLPPPPRQYYQSKLQEHHVLEPIKLHEPSQQPRLTPKLSREATGTSSGVSTTASFGSVYARSTKDISSEFKEPPRLITAYRTPSNPHVPRLNLSELENFSSPNTQETMHQRRQHESNNSPGSLQCIVTTKPELIDNRTEGSSLEIEPLQQRLIVRKVSETYKKWCDGTWRGLGVRERTVDLSVDFDAAMLSGIKLQREIMKEPCGKIHIPCLTPHHHFKSIAVQERGVKVDSFELDTIPYDDINSKALGRSQTSRKHNKLLERDISSERHHMKNRLVCNAEQRNTVSPQINDLERKCDREIISSIKNDDLFDRTFFEEPSSVCSALSSASSILHLPKLHLSKLDEAPKKKCKTSGTTIKTAGFKTARPVVRVLKSSSPENSSVDDLEECEKSAICFGAISTGDTSTEQSSSQANSRCVHKRVDQPQLVNSVARKKDMNLLIRMKADSQLKCGSITERGLCGRVKGDGIEVVDPGNQTWLKVTHRKGKQDKALRRGNIMNCEKGKLKIDLIDDNSNVLGKVESGDYCALTKNQRRDEKFTESLNHWLMHVHSIPEHVILSVNDFELKRKEKQYDYDEGYERSSSIPRFEEINNGTFCTVIKGSLRGKDVAVKCPLKFHLENDPEMMRVRALKELRLLTRAAGHDNILKLCGGVIKSEYEIWIITELIRGGDLYTRLYPEPRSDFSGGLETVVPRIVPSQRLKIMLQLASALSHLHGLNPKIVHKDLKTNNILVDDISFDIRLCDFGDAEEIRPGENLKYYTAVTWQYAPPEIILSRDPSRPERYCNESVDIWSLGCIFLELCGESTPFWHVLERLDPSRHHIALQKYLERVSGGKGFACFKGRSFFRSRLPHCLSVLIDWCLDFEPSSRPTAKQVYFYILQFKSSLLKELIELQDIRRRRKRQVL